MTLPRGWTRYYNLRAGDKLEVIADGKLIIRPEKERPSSTRPRRPSGK
ncbi:AbrB/MazE/SpoVT family DNA-binding domain-containing protein [Bacteroidota bacterium]